MRTPGSTVRGTPAVLLLAVAASLLGHGALAGCQRARERPSEPTEAKVGAVNDDAAILTLFDEAEACADRYNCPPLAKLQERAERLGETAVLRVAFDIMVDPKVDTFERRFKMASATARAWAVARASQGRRMSPTDEGELRKQVMRLLGRADNAVPAHGFVEYLADAREIFQREALDPRRGNDEVHSAIRGLRDREPDLTTVKAWLGATEERPMVAGALLLDAFDHAKLRADDEVAALLPFARRKDTAPEAARIVAKHAAEHGDAAFAPVLRAFELHGDASVRELASKALALAH
jgi:hypothetical protein